MEDAVEALSGKIGRTWIKERWPRTGPRRPQRRKKDIEILKGLYASRYTLKMAITEFEKESRYHTRRSESWVRVEWSNIHHKKYRTYPKPSCEHYIHPGSLGCI